MERHFDPYPKAVAEALKRELGSSRRAVKTAMRWTGAGERTVKNWFSARCGPNGRHLAALARHSDEVLAAFLGLAGRQQMMASPKLVDFRVRLAAMLGEIDRMILGDTR
jgi:hypothetical protein